MQVREAGGLWELRAAPCRQPSQQGSGALRPTQLYNAESCQQPMRLEASFPLGLSDQNAAQVTL